MKTLDLKDIIKLHFDTFGFEPVITGINFNDSLDIAEKILNSIEDGVPYIEQDVPKEVDI